MDYVYWQATFAENKSKLLSAAGYSSPEETIVTEVSVTVMDELEVFRPEESKYWSLLYCEYCKEMGWSLEQVKSNARAFFAELWKPDHGGFISALYNATAINIKTK